MTRVNAGVHPSELHRRHLIAEYREIPMVPASLRRSLRTKDENEVLKDIPLSFTLNKGHVRFFYNKLNYLRHRYYLLVEEMLHRGYTTDSTRDPDFSGFPVRFYNFWTETIEARNIILERITQRINEKPHLYN